MTLYILCIIQLQKPVFCKVEGARLDGYFCACAGVTGNTGNMQTLYERVQGSLQNNFHVSNQFRTPLLNETNPSHSRPLSALEPF